MVPGKPLTASAAEHAHMFGIDEIIMRIIHARGHDTPETIESYLFPRISADQSPFLLDGMYGAVEKLRIAISNGSKIGIFADSDLDGITSLTVIHSLLARIKLDPFIRYLKDDENYGITRDIIDEFNASGVQLIITVDAGMRDIEEIAYARSLGMDVIVTDHHEPEEVLPDAIVINPKKRGCPYPFKHLAGVGVAMKLCLALLMSYLPSFKKPFIIVRSGDSGYMLALIRDGIIESESYGVDFQAVCAAIDRAGPESTVLVADDGALTGLLSSEFAAIKVTDFSDFVSRISDPSTSSAARAPVARHPADDKRFSLIISQFLEAQVAASHKISDYLKSVMGLVAIGSVADVIPLVGENRLLVKQGIDSLNSGRDRSISLLLNGEPLNSRTIGWSIAPLLNTPGRVGKTELAVRFFLETDRTALEGIIAEMRALNESRRSFIGDFCETMLADPSCGSINAGDGLIIIKTDAIPDGYAGLVANRLSDATGRPVIVAVLPGKDGLVKGSGRSRSGGNFFSIVERLRDRFERIGGHENAFGFTLSVDRLDETMELLKREMADVPVMIDSGEAVDAELDPGTITTRFIDQLSLLEPFGAGNEEPLFRSRGVRASSFTQFGKNHGRYVVHRGSGLMAVGWGMGPLMKECFDSGRPLDLVFRLENNSFNGSVTPRMIIQSVRCAQA